ncbi:MAG: LPS export ABC transporter periplasmic protein LptC [Armatimonadota bacterium]
MTREMRTRQLAATGLAVLLACGVPSAQQTSGPASDTNPEKKKTETVTYEAKLLRAVWGSENKILLTGGVRFTHGDTVLTCDEVQYDRDTNVAVSPGKVRITDPNCDITGDRGTAYFKKRIGVVEGNVTLLVKPRPEEEKPSDDRGSAESIRAKLAKPTMVTCQKLEYNYRTKVATASGGVFLKQEKRSASAQKLVYDEKNEIITLLGDVKGVDEDGQTFSAPEKVVMCVKKGAEWMEAPNATATFKVETEEESPQ